MASRCRSGRGALVAAAALVLTAGCESWMTWNDELPPARAPAALREAPPPSGARAVAPVVAPDRQPGPSCHAALPPQGPLPVSGCVLRWSCPADAALPVMERVCSPASPGVHIHGDF